MDLIAKRSPLAVFSQGEGKEQQIDLSKISPRDFFKNDIVRHKITGDIPSLPEFRLTNFVESILHKVTASGVDFSECDFKDSLIKESVFVDCRFDNGTFATSYFFGCTFSRCTFYNVAVYGSDFRSTQFLDCDLSNFLVKSSRLFSCEIKSCHTTNKIFEMSTLDSTLFSSTNIQIETITSNFGIFQEDLVESKIRTARVREDHQLLEPSDISVYLADKPLTPIERLRVEYFVDRDLTRGSIALDESLNITRWTQIYKNPGSFVALLESFSEFIANSYEKGEIQAHTVLLLHNVTSNLTRDLPTVEDLHRVAMSIGGTHLILSRLVEEFLEVLDSIMSSGSHNITFLVQGPFDTDYFKQELGPWLEGTQIVRLVKHNSPLEMEVSATHIAALVPLVAAFLATRTRLEILRLKERGSAVVVSPVNARKALPKKGTSSKAAKAEENTKQGGENLFSISTGPSEDQRYMIQVRSILPGSLMVDLKLDFSTRLAGKLRKAIVDILSIS